MKIALNNSDKDFLKSNSFEIEYEKDYSDDEFLKILDDLYFLEISNVEIDDKKANRFADIADRIANMN